MLLFAKIVGNMDRLYHGLPIEIRAVYHISCAPRNLFIVVDKELGLTFPFTGMVRFLDHI